LAAVAADDDEGLPGLRLAVRLPAMGGALRDGSTPTVPALPGAAVVDWDDLADFGADVDPAEVEARADAVTGEDLADILFTSGTTGKSKGVLTAHRQTVGIAEAWAECAEITADDRYLVINPFFHSFGYKAGFLVCLLHGATIVPLAVFDVAAVMSVIAEQKITVVPGDPTTYQSILDHPERAD